MASVQEVVGCRLSGSTTLVEADYAAVALRLKCDVPAIKAVTAVEAPRGAFDSQGRPSILFERHVFHRLTGGKFDRIQSDISSPLRGGYGPYSVQHDRLQRAFDLDQPAALKSASWGAFQIMGENYASAGFESIFEFVRGMWSSAGAQLEAFADFIERTPSGWAALQHHDWETFARSYNGPSFKANSYDSKLKFEYEKAKG